jgi:HEAT repeat protein
MGSREAVAWALAVLFVLSTGGALATRSSADHARALGADELRQLKEENQRLRSSVVALRGEGLALRTELDRLLGAVRAGSAATASVPNAPEAGSAAPAASGEEVRAVSSEIATLSQDFTRGGGPEGMRALFQKISQLQAMGAEALPSMKAAFNETSDPAARRILASIIATKGGPAEEQFLLAAAERESDPQMKQALLTNAGMAGGQDRGRAEADLRDMAGSTDPAARAAAMRGFTDLADPQTATAVEGALANDSSEEVRLAALDALMQDPSRRAAALDTAAHDRSERIRGIAECRERLSELEGPAK